LLEACARHYGSFTAARKAAGIEGIPGGEKRWNQERVVEPLQVRARVGEPVTGKALGRTLLTACWRYFGGLDATLEAAGLDRG